jgi:hypothetical protein
VKGESAKPKGLANDRNGGFFAANFQKRAIIRTNYTQAKPNRRPAVMTYLTLNIEANTPEAHSIEALAAAEHIDPKAAALKLMKSSPLARKSKATPAAQRIIGLFSSPEDAALMDEVMELVMSERERQNAEPPRV